MPFEYRRSAFFSRLNLAPLRGIALIVAGAFIPSGYGQRVQPDHIPVKNWALHKSSDQALSYQGAAVPTSGLVFIAITPCRVMDTREAGGSGKTNAFGPPSLVAGQARALPVPSSNCGVPVAAAYSMNVVSITPSGQGVNWIAAWQDDIAWSGTVVVNALQGGIVDDSAIVPAGADGGIQVLATNNADVVIDMNGYFVQAATMQGPSGPPGPIGPTGMTGLTGATGAIGPTGSSGAPELTGAAGLAAATGTAGPTGPTGAIGPSGPIGLSGATGAIGPIGSSGATGLAGAAGTTGSTGLTGPIGPSGSAGPSGATGAAGLTGAAGSSGAMAFSDFFALIPTDDSPTVGIGTDVSFPRNGSSSGSAIARTSASAFNLSAIGTYQVMFNVSVNEPGQLNLSLNGADLDYTLAGRATGTSQIIGISLVTTTAIDSLLTVRNPANNSTALTITPAAGGTRAVSAHLVITRIQ